MDEKEVSVKLREENKLDENEGFCHIDKEMVRFKIHFFLLFGAMGSMMPYVPLIAKNRIGISATSLATILTVSLFSTMLTKTAIGYVADYFKRMKIIISVLIITHCMFYLSFLMIPPVREIKTSTQDSSFLDFFKDFENDTELTIISIRSNANCNESEDVLSSVEDEVKLLESDVACSLKNNAMKCFKSNDNVTSNRLELQHANICCEVYTTKLYQLYHKLEMIKNYFHLSSFELPHMNRSKNSLCTKELLDGTAGFYKHESTSDFEAYQFWIYAAFMILAETCSSSVFTLSDTVCFESVQKYKRDFGRQRIYSAISWGLLAPLGGLLCDLTNSFYATWVLMASLQCLTVWNMSKLKIVVPHFSHNITKDIRSILKSPNFLAFQFGVFINGVWSGIISFYLIWFVSSLGASAFLCGLIPYIQNFAGSLPFMFFSGKIIEKFGQFHLITLSLLSYAVRFLCYSYLGNPWFVLPIEFMHGLNYGLYYPAVASFGKLSAKPGTEATTQSILFSTHEGLGAGVGCVLTGIGFDTFGSHWTFFYFSLFAFGSTLLNICLTTLLQKRFTKGE